MEIIIDIFNSTLIYNSKILEKNNKILKNNMTKYKYPKGTHIYILEDDNKYKIGYIDDLNKKLQSYNTKKVKKVNKAEYAYYKKKY